MSVAENGLAQLKQFIIDNNIVGTSAGVCIALATKDVIQSFVGEIIIPIVIILLHSLHIDLFAKYLPVKGGLNITDFIKQLVTFIFITVISFIFVKFAFGYLLGIPGKNDDEKKDTAAVAVVAAEKKAGFSNYWP
jgi:large-conductance mechanosensitive channel